MKYISEEDLRAHLITDNCDDGCGYLDERDMPSLSWIELDEDEKERVGHWIKWYEQKENNGYTENIPHCKCSECNIEYDSHTSQFIKYCPNCGAKMVESQESEVDE